MSPEAPTEGVPKFQSFVNWGFYSCIILIGWGILNKFDTLSVEVSSIRNEMSQMNIQLVRTLERQSFNDKEIQDNSKRIDNLELEFKRIRRD